MKHIILSALALGVGATLSAMPAKPGLITTRQPDGTEISLHLHGDEHAHWAVTADGYTLLQDAEGYWAFAERDAEAVVASSLRYQGDVDRRAARARGITPGISPITAKARGTVQKAPAVTQIGACFPATGKRNLLMLLINYADTQPVFAQKAFDDYMNAEQFKGIGSFRDYYLENSYGKLEINTKVTRWVTLPYAKSYYGADGVVNMIRDALMQIDDEIDLRDFDNDGDGVLDGLAVIHQGTGQEASADSRDIWSHTGDIYGISFDGIELRRYTVQPEILASNSATPLQSTIGVMCHEFGHNLGAPDFYDTDYASSGGEFPGTGVWDLMGSGAWNGNYGDRPAGTNMWQKIRLGWADPVQLTQTCTVSDMPGSTFVPAAYRFDTTVPGEYFILENRQRQGNFDSALPGHGLLVYHVDEARISDRIAVNTINTDSRQALYTVCAGASSEPGNDAASYGWVNSDAAPFPGSAASSSFTDTTVPSTKSNTGRYTYRGLTRIAENASAETVSFDFIQYDTPASPRNLTARAEQGIVHLEWDAPAGEAPVAYNVFRNSRQIASVTAPGYIDSRIGEDTDLEYAVDCEYASGLVSPYSSAALYIPTNHIVTLTAEANGADIALQWGLNRQLTRMPNVGEKYFQTNYSGSTVEIAHRYRASDLAVYRGYKIRQIAFFPLQGPREITVRLTVYGVDGAGKRTVLSQRNVSEIGNTSWNIVTLTKQVTIDATQDIEIAVQFTPASGNVQLLTDQGPLLNGYGNLVNINGKGFEADESLKGNFFLYANLVEPEAAHHDMPEVTPAELPRIDTAMPLGFAVYRNGELLGKTGGRLFTDTSVPTGSHTYAVTNLYKGDNESGAVTTDISVDNGGSGVSTPVADPMAMAVQGTRGGIAIDGVAGKVTVRDLSGAVRATAVAGTTPAFVAAAPGLYLVTIGTRTWKIAFN